VVFESLRDFIKPDQSRPAIEVERVTETFRLYHEKGVGLKERLYRLRRAGYTDFNALEDVTFTIEHGETVGIIGHNGSGKSTLLKTLARILPPDEGRVEINGRVATLLELGAGFHGDLTGRENIYLNGAILGFTRSQIAVRFDEIVEFAGIRPFLDTPVRNYSSGMYVRLGFAIAINVDPDILLVDEVLSVGDAKFQAKSLDAMRRIQEREKTVVLVSHDLGSIQDLCDRVLVMEQGRVVFDGPVREGVQLYQQLMESSGPDLEDPDQHERYGSGDVVIRKVGLLDAAGMGTRKVKPSAGITLRVKVVAQRDVKPFSVGARIQTGDGKPLYEVHTTWQGLGVGPLERGESAIVDIRLRAHVLAGYYAITPMITDSNGKRVYDALPRSVQFEVEPAPGGTGMVDFRAAVSVADGPAVNLDDTGREEDVPADPATPEAAKALHPSHATADPRDDLEGTAATSDIVADADEDWGGAPAPQHEDDTDVFRAIG